MTSQLLSSTLTEPIVKSVRVTPVFKRNHQAREPYVINIGGARSSKSHSIAQLLIKKFSNERNKKILITRKTGPALFLTAYSLVVKLLQEYGIYRDCIHNKSHNVIIHKYSGSMFVFSSIDDPEKIKSTEWNYVWLEEASEYTWDDFLIIKTRMSGATVPEEPNQIFMSLNPTEEQGWINQKMILSGGFAKKINLIRSTYKDNPHLSKEYVEELKSLKDQDMDAYRIYALGEYGALTNIIYRPYEIEKKMPTSFDEVIYGLDFGYNNPSALMRIVLKDNEPHLEQKLYQTHLTNQELIETCKQVMPKDELEANLYADCAEPDRIEEFSRAGFNIYPADKEVKTGLDFCKRFKFYSLASNSDCNKERASYKWKTDRNGNVLDEPVKFMDHCMDAKRYALYTHYKEAGVAVTFS